MSIMLICSVGGTPQPVVASIREYKPARVVLWHTAATRDAANKAILDSNIAEGMVDYRVVRDEQDFTFCVQDVRALRSDVDAWLGRSTQHEVIVDFTGGTKLMSAALALVAHRWRCRFAYIGGSQRTKDGVGIVMDGSEKAFHSENPFNSLAYQPLIDGISLHNAGFPASAARLLDQVVRRGDLDPSIKRSLIGVQHIFNGYAAWDSFRHADAAKKFDDAIKAINDIRAALPRQDFVPTLTNHRDRCQLLADLGHKPSIELVHDLIANADRRAETGQFDDAVARLYRATEALAQAKLADHQIDTAAVPIERLPESLRTEFQPASANEDICKLGLQQAFTLLRTLDEASAKPFFDAKLDTKTSPLTARNQSILAHGFQPTSDNTFKSLRGAVGKLTLEYQRLNFLILCPE